MGYSTNGALNNVTPIELLPDLEDLDGGSSIIPNEHRNKAYNKIRPHNNKFHNDSGMNQQPTIIRQPSYVNNNIKQAPRPSLPNEQEKYGIPIVEEHFKTFNMPPGTPSCLDVAEHIANCPICSKFYNTDKTIYIIAIISLAIICILLLKKVLDV